jgi:hypothetical protein
VAVVAAAALVVAGATGGALALSHRDGDRPTLSVPAGLRAAWSHAHVLEGQHVALAWGDALPADPTRAPVDVRFDPQRAVAQLDALYAFDVTGLRVVRADGPIAHHKVLVVVDGSWSRDAPPPAERGIPTGGLSTTVRGGLGGVTDGVGVLHVQPGALRGTGGTSGPTSVGTDLDPSWELARGFAETVQDFAHLDEPGGGFASDAATTFWPVSAAYLASLASPSRVGDLSDLLRAPQLHWGSARLGDGGWLLLRYLADRDGDQLVGDLWRSALTDEDPLTTYQRITGLTEGDLARRVTEYAMRTVTWDFSDNSALAQALAHLDPALTAGRTTPVTAVTDDPGRYRVLDAFAPADYGFNLVRLDPAAPGATIRLRLRAHVGPAGGGVSVGFVALDAHGVARYSPVTTGVDAEVQFPLHAGEKVAYLVVAGSPTTHAAHGAAAAVGDATRYPYEFRLSGATVDDGAGVVPSGMHRVANGGGLVDDRATVAATAYVGPDAVVRGDAQVLEHARVEGRAWVEAGATVRGDAVVRDVAVVRSGAVLQGDVVVGGDAVVRFTCAAGAYTRYSPERRCDGTNDPPDVNRPPTPFTAADLALHTPSATQPPTTAPTPPTAPTTAPPSSSPTHGSNGPGGPGGGTPGSDGSGQHGGSGSGPGGGSGDPGGSGDSGGSGGGHAPAPPASTAPPNVEPPDPVAAGPCQATYQANTAWTDGTGEHYFQAQVRVTGTGDGVRSWSVGWTVPAGVQITDVWNAQLGMVGRTVTAENESYNGTVKPGQDVVFSFQGTAPSEEIGKRVPSITCTPGR